MEGNGWWASFEVLFIRSITSKTPIQNRIRFSSYGAQVIPKLSATKKLTSSLRKVRKKRRQFSPINPLLHYSKQWLLLLLGPASLFLFMPGQQTANPANLRKALIKLLPHLGTLALYKVENQNTKQPFFVNYVREFADQIDILVQLELHLLLHSANAKKESKQLTIFFFDALCGQT